MPNHMQMSNSGAIAIIVIVTIVILVLLIIKNRKDKKEFLPPDDTVNEQKMDQTRNRDKI